MKRITQEDRTLIELLQLATSLSKAEAALKRYITYPDQRLYAVRASNQTIGCVGIKIEKGGAVIIQHIAVRSSYRQQGIGKEMIDYLKQGLFSAIQAETDNDAVHFYQKQGFQVTSLGEKYPGVERFLCVWQKDG
ncbi:GNAT family N-acetyltransferase [Halobacillus litoralis]|uniref:GNAT family N-acetyltransferase n=1 Tax=Halobacillus litoralis TaxID=45668 RepID=UPI001CD66F4A|nr:GNAT family N-acetyltransferase [Halobacillus litoralis]MCA0969004.1 GNAT family N-acetyltransferase [Halobacillus litoralis]